MRQIFLFLAALSFLSCVSTPRTNTDDINNREPENQANFARVIFYNYSRNDIYLFLEKTGDIAKNIKDINIKEYSSHSFDVSLISSGKSTEFIIPSGDYTIVPMKDKYGNKRDEDFDEYDELYFVSSEEPYIIRLFPKHKQSNTTTASITYNNSHINNQDSLFPSFNIQFSDEMIKPFVERNIELTGEDKKPIKIDIQWHNDYKLTIRPQESLKPLTQYFIRVENGARNVEGELIKEVVPYPLTFRTGNYDVSISPFDTASVKYTYIPGKIQLDWTLPPGARGTEMHIEGKSPEDELYAKTNYTFSNDVIEQIKYKILPYGIKDEEKVYNKADEQRSFTNIPRLYTYGINHTVITNTVDRLEFRFTFIDTQKITPDFQFILRNNLEGVDLKVLNAQNNFTYRTGNPPLIPEEEITYILTIDNSAVDYSFTIKRPSDSEFYEDFEKKVIKDMEAIAQEFIAIDKKSFTISGELEKDILFYKEKNRMLFSIITKYDSYNYPKAHNLESYKKRVQSNEVFSRIRNLYIERYDLLLENLIVSAASSYNTADDRIVDTKNWLDGTIKEFENYTFWSVIKDKTNVKTAIENVNKKYMKYTTPKNNLNLFWGIGASVGSSFTAPWLTGTVQVDISPFSYTILELGCDFGLIHGYERRDIEYYSLYPFGHLVFSPFIKKGKNNPEPFIIYAGIGGGAMFSSYKTATEDNFFTTPAADFTAGFYLGQEHNYLHVSYTLRTTFSAVNHKAAVGYTYRF